MTALFGFTYSTNLSQEEKADINHRTAKAREQFSIGFTEGSKISVVICAFYLVTSATKAFAADPPLAPNPTSSSRPGFKPVSELLGGAGAISAAASESMDFYWGLGFALFLVIGGIIINRPKHK
jgi:hypothetical protein